MTAKNIKRVLFAVLALFAFWWAGESYMEAGLAARTFFFGGFGVLLAYSAATGAG